MKNDFDEIVCEMASILKVVFTELFNNNEKFYYCTFLTTGEGLPPLISAWSEEALKREGSLYKNADEYREIKWSYADSPYYAFRYERFSHIFSSRPLMITMDEKEWEKEFLFRLNAMETAVRQVDKEGIFSINQKREDICVEVGTMPPDKLTTEITKRLNNPDSLIMKEYMAEAAE